MTLNKTTVKAGIKTFFINTVRFAFILLFINLFARFFGQENLLPSIAIIVALLTFPVCDMALKPSSMTFLLFFFFVGSGLVSALSLLNLWAGLALNFIFIYLMMAFCSEPSALRPHIIFLLCYIFCQASPVTGHAFTLRMAGLLTGAAITAAVTAVCWKIKGFDPSSQRSLKQQVRLCQKKDQALILKMTLGLTLAMFIGMAFGLRKPLWISIVVMSLTQADYGETLTRIKHRSVATLAGIVLFVLLFQMLVPEGYGGFLILLLGYIGNYQFAKPYKYQQVINFMSALFASLVLFDLTSAIINRVLCLLTGILIVVVIRHLGAFTRKTFFSTMTPDPEN
ncbi:FUSC family protein [Eubacterium sp. 1001713B170207_170306_E7]|uniref:FUSC family protein n=1 Tax=Eubacterium sp. 1001713B170207_170306_E7 TaxID=2787097 RepID=UPI0018997211|nr:FUSC family protein [Eubacterium sp. 1001713B170207_170306_E7]